MEKWRVELAAGAPSVMASRVPQLAGASSRVSSEISGREPSAGQEPTAGRVQTVSWPTGPTTNERIQDE